jgi:acyl-CoA thioester hydrolase
MADFQFFHPVEVRYGDLDPQGHVNNARYLTYFEQARVSYIVHLGLWKHGSFMDFGLILADAQVTFKAPVLFGQRVQVGVRSIRLGNKSMTMEYRLEDIETGKELATGSSVMVAYNYHKEETIPIPTDWRQRIEQFENLAPAG